MSTPFGFAGQYTDAETGLQYLQARYYDPATMQFMSVDPLVDVTGRPYAYRAANPLNATDPSGLCDNVNSVSLFGQTYTVRYHVPLTDQSHALCVDEAMAMARNVVEGVNNGLTGFANSDFSNAVSGDVLGLVNQVQGLAHLAGSCLQDTQACAQATQLLAQYIHDHPREVLDALVQTQVAQAQQVAQEIRCGQYGAAAGHLLVAFVLYKGGGKLTDALTGALGGVLRGTAEETAAEEAAAQSTAPRVPDAVGCSGCFPAGTLVATPSGLRPIQTLHVRDKVLAEDPKTHKVEAEPLQAVVHDPTSPLLAIDLSDGSTITTTLTHAFWVDAGVGLAHAGWFYAEHLRVGDQLRTDNGKHIIVIGLRYNAGRADVYTLTVARDHTFFVGSAQVLVHNCAARNLQKIARRFHLDVNNPAIQVLDMTVDEFIAQYRDARIRGRMPGEYLGQTVREALESGNTTVRKLLTDNRWAK